MIIKNTLAISLIFVVTYSLYGQSPSDSISIKRGLGPVFIQHGEKLNARALLEITSVNSEAHKEMKIAKGNSDAGSVIGFAGGFLVGWPLGTALGGGDPNWTLAAIGAGLIVISIPFENAYSKHARKAVAIYNAGLRQSARSTPEIRLGMSYNGFGVRVKF